MCSWIALIGLTIPFISRFVNTVYSPEGRSSPNRQPGYASIALEAPFVLRAIYPDRGRYQGDRIVARERVVRRHHQIARVTQGAPPADVTAKVVTALNYDGWI